jgi:hypothetical protein
MKKDHTLLFIIIIESLQRHHLLVTRLTAYGDKNKYRRNEKEMGCTSKIDVQGSRGEHALDSEWPLLKTKKKRKCLQLLLAGKAGNAWLPAAAGYEGRGGAQPTGVGGRGGGGGASHVMMTGWGASAPPSGQSTWQANRLHCRPSVLQGPTRGRGSTGHLHARARRRPSHWAGQP